MGLLDLPNELLLLISSYLQEPEIYSLVRTNSRLWAPLTPELHKRAPRVCRNVYRRGDLNIRCTLHWAAWKGHKALFQLLLDKDVSIECPVDVHHCHSQETVLHFAAFKGDEAIVRLLLERRANVNQEDETGTTPLHFAAMRGHEEIVRLLLDNGGDATAVDRAGLSVISKTLKSNVHDHTTRNANVFKLLAKGKANLDAKDKEGETALHLAVKYTDLEALETLLDLGANPYIESADGETVIDLALIQTFPDPSTNPITKDKCEQTYQVVKLLQRKGLIPTLGGKFYDVRRPKGKREYWKLACGCGFKNQAKSIMKAWWTSKPCPIEQVGRYYRMQQIRANRSLRGVTTNYYNYNK